MKWLHYKELPVEAKAAFWFAFCTILQRGIAFLSMPIFTRLMSEGEFGLYSIFNAWLNLLGLFLTFSLSAGVFTNAMHKYRNDRDNYIASMHGLSLAIWLIFGVLFCLDKDFWLRHVFENSPFLAFSIFLYHLFMPGYNFWTSRQRFEYRYVQMTVVTVSASVFALLSGILGACLNGVDKKAQGAFSGYVATNCVVGLLCSIYNLRKSRKLFHAFYWKRALRFNLPLLPHYLSTVVLGQADRIMIGRYVGNVEAGMYSFVYTIALVLNVLTSSLNQAISPWQYARMDKGDYGSISSLWNMILLPFGLIVVLIATLAPEIIVILGPATYHEAARIVPPIVLGVFFNALYVMMFGVLEFYCEANFFIMAASVSGAFANVVLNSIFIPRFGYVAAAYTTLVCYLISAVAHGCCASYLANKNFRVLSIYDLKFTLCVSLCVSAGIFSMLSLYQNFALRLTVAALLLLLLLLYGRRSLRQIIRERIESRE